MVAVLSVLSPTSATTLTKTIGECVANGDCEYTRPDGITELAGVCKHVTDSWSVCECKGGYTGANCQYKECPRAPASKLMCNGIQGEGDDYHGPVSSEWNQFDAPHDVDFAPSHPTSSFGGICNFTTGTCWCHPGYRGMACDIRTCPIGTRSQVCSGQGNCIKERAGQNSFCQCFPGFHGHDCSKMPCPVSSRELACDDRGSCDESIGFCVCDPGFYGKDCSRFGGTQCDESLVDSIGLGYRGCQTRTRSGRTCQPWDSHSPHVPGWAANEHAEKHNSRTSNYCRNVEGGGSTIWCYTSDPAVRWEYCDPLPKTSQLSLATEL